MAEEDEEYERRYQDGDGKWQRDRRSISAEIQRLMDTHNANPWAHGAAASRLVQESSLRSDIVALQEGLQTARESRAELHGAINAIRWALGFLALLVSSFGGTTLYFILHGR